MMCHYLFEFVLVFQVFLNHLYFYTHFQVYIICYFYRSCLVDFCYNCYNNRYSYLHNLYYHCSYDSFYYNLDLYCFQFFQASIYQYYLELFNLLISNQVVNVLDLASLGELFKSSLVLKCQAKLIWQAVQELSYCLKVVFSMCFLQFKLFFIMVFAPAFFKL